MSFGDIYSHMYLPLLVRLIGYEAYISKIVYYTGPFVPAFHQFIDGMFCYIRTFTGCHGVGMIQSFLGGVLIGPHESVCMNSSE